MEGKVLPRNLVYHPEQSKSMCPDFLFSTKASFNGDANGLEKVDLIWNGVCSLCSVHARWRRKNRSHSNVKKNWEKVGLFLHRGPAFGYTLDEQHRSAAIKTQKIRGDKR